MAFLTALWIPILAASVAVFFCSFLAWAVLPHHKGDNKALPDEDGFMAHVRGLGLAPGQYMFPNCATNAQSRDPEFIKKFEAGPAGLLNIFPQMNMGKNMGLTFLVFLVVTTLIAYVSWAVLPAGSEFARVFQVVATIGVLSHAFSHMPNGIWFNAGGRAIFLCFLDGVAYGLVTGLIFALLWPAASVPGLPGLPG